MRALIAAALLLAGSAYAGEAMVAHGPNGETVHITHDACTNEAVVAQIAEVAQRYRDLFYAATATVDGKLFQACWIVDGEFVHVLYEDADQGMIPMSDFKPDGV